MRQNGSFCTFIFILILSIGTFVAFLVNAGAGNAAAAGVAIGFFLVAILAASAIRVPDLWDRAVILRLGQFQALKGPGLFFIIPVVDAIPYRIDTRVITTRFKAEKTLTKETVPVDVDAVLFWKVVDPKLAALDVVSGYEALVKQKTIPLGFKTSNSEGAPNGEDIKHKFVLARNWSQCLSKS